MELKNGYYNCFLCRSKRPEDKVMAEYYESLFFKCMICEFGSIKTKRSEMHIEPEQDLGEPMCCRVCFQRTQNKETIFRNRMEMVREREKEREREKRD